MRRLFACSPKDWSKWMLSLKLRPTPTKSVQEHQLIIDAIRKGLPLEAHNHARAHRAHARDMLLPLLERFGIKHL
jgi:DNA-binding GntR family transcriptional regulator